MSATVTLPVLVHSADQTASDLFGQAQLGDRRIAQRLCKVMADLLRQPGKWFSQIYATRKEEKAAYRLIENPRLCPEKMSRAIAQSAARTCQGQKVILAPQDTTTLSYSHRQKPVPGLGPVLKGKHKKGQGLFLHTTLALDERGLPLGILNQQTWVRDGRHKSGDRTRYQRRRQSIEEKESGKWPRALRASQEVLREVCGAAAPHVIHIMDREGDIFEVFEEAARLPHTGVVVRAAWDRRVDSEYRYLWETLEARPSGGTYTVEVPARGGQPARQAEMEVRWATVTLRPPATHRHSSPQTVQAVYVVETNAPEGSEALEWMLLTTEPVEDFAGACRIVEIYTVRWRVEEYHLALKSGCGMEKMQLQSRANLERMLRPLSVTALRIVGLRYWAEAEPDAPAQQILSEAEREALAGYVRQRFGKTPPEQMTVSWVRTWIGRIGGHRGRKGDGEPGIRVLWRGWRDFELIVQAYQAFSSLGKCG